jgi:ribosomal protein S27AE
MTENVIKKHQCPSCGGNLIVDSVKQMYSCSFCGSTYDYEYFREEEMYDLASSYLAHKEYHAAADAYRFVLDKDPNDLLARRGLMLAAGHLENVDEILTEDTMTGFSFDSEIAEEATQGAPEDQKSYFEELSTIFKTLDDYSAHIREMKDLREQQSKVSAKIAAKDASAKEYYSRSGSSPMVDSIIMYITMGIATCAFLFFGLALGTEVAIIFAICAVVLDIVIGLIIHKAITPRVKAVEKIEKERGVLYVEEGNIRRRIKTLDAEADKLRLQLDRTCPGFVQKDKELTSKKEDI